MRKRGGCRAERGPDRAVANGETRSAGTRHGRQRSRRSRAEARIDPMDGDEVRLMRGSPRDRPGSRARARRRRPRDGMTVGRPSGFARGTFEGRDGIDGAEGGDVSRHGDRRRRRRGGCRRGRGVVMVGCGEEDAGGGGRGGLRSASGAVAWGPRMSPVRPVRLRDLQDLERGRGARPVMRQGGVGAAGGRGVRRDERGNDQPRRQGREPDDRTYRARRHHEIRTIRDVWRGPPRGGDVNGMKTNVSRQSASSTFFRPAFPGIDEGREG
jgi:hypothetical protein